MKKKLFNLFAICLCAIAFLASCGGPKDATKELEISIDNENCINKSYPTFIEELKKLELEVLYE